MKVGLIGEGTYPHQFGGVSVWCDQLVRGLPQHDFTLVPLVATGNEPMRWQLPDNVKSVATIPLWGRPPSVPLRSRLSRGRNDSMLPELIDVLLSPPAEEQGRFTDVMHELFTYAQTRSLQAALASETTVRLLSDAWQQRWSEILPVTSRVGPLSGPGGRSGGELGDGAADGPDGHAEESPKRTVPTLADAVAAVQLLEHALRPFSHPPVQADVVHAVTNGLGVLPGLAAKWRYGLPLIVTEHGLYMREQYLHMRRPEFGWPVKHLYLRFLRRLCTLGYHQADIITPGNIYNKRWEAELGADASRVRTVYNGVDPAVFPVVDDEPEVPTISWAGRIDPVKDLETLLRAFSLVVKDIPQARLRMFGAPPPGGEAYLERCRAEAADLGLSEQATFEGRVPKIRDAYAAGHVVVLCSISEGFPYTLIEAMACGRACVATDVGGVSEAIGDEAGLIVPPRNPAALADACLRLLQDETMRRTMGALARARAIEHFTMDRAVSAFDEMYTLLGSAPKQAAIEDEDAVLDTVATAEPQAEANRTKADTATQMRGRIALPAEEGSTVVTPGPDADSRAGADAEITQVMPALGTRLARPDSEQTLILPRLDLGTPQLADQDQTEVIPRLAPFPESSGEEPPGPLPLLTGESQELPGDEQTAGPEPPDGQPPEPAREEGETAAHELPHEEHLPSSGGDEETAAQPELTEAMR